MKKFALCFLITGTLAISSCQNPTATPSGSKEPGIEIGSGSVDVGKELMSIKDNPNFSGELKQFAGTLNDLFAQGKLEEMAQKMERTTGINLPEETAAQALSIDGNSTPLDIPTNDINSVSINRDHEILTKDSVQTTYYNSTFNPTIDESIYLEKNTITIMTNHDLNHRAVALVDSLYNPIPAVTALKFLRGKMLLNSPDSPATDIKTRNLYQKTIETQYFPPGFFGNFSAEKRPEYWRDKINKAFGGFTKSIKFKTSIKDQVIEYDFTKANNLAWNTVMNSPTTLVLPVEAETARFTLLKTPIFMPFVQSNDTAPFAELIAGNTKRKVLIHIHGTLLFHYGPFIPYGYDYNKNLEYLEASKKNVYGIAKIIKEQKGLTIDLTTQFKWSGGNKPEYRAKASRDLKKFIYEQAAKGLQKGCGTEFYLVTHSHGTSVATLMIKSLNMSDLGKYFSSINRLISFNGVARPEYLQSEVKHINFYAPNEDGIVPRAWNDYVVMGDASDSWQPLAIIASGLTYALYQVLDSRNELYTFTGKEKYASDINILKEIPTYANKYSGTTDWRDSHEGGIKDWEHFKKLMLLAIK